MNNLNSVLIEGNLIHDLKVWALAHKIANEFDAVPMEKEYLDEVREAYLGEPLLEEVLSRYSGNSSSDMVSNLVYKISKLMEE